MTHLRINFEVKAARRGILLLEITVAVAMLASLLIIVNKMMVQLHQQTAAIDRERLAQQTVENLLEELTSKNWSSVNVSDIDTLSIPESTRQRLSNATIEGDIVERDDPVASKRVTLRLRWFGESNVARTLSLTAWVYPNSGDTP